MINLGIIGTNWITRRMLDAASETGKYKLTAVYSRNLETGRKFAEQNNCDHVFTDLNQFMHDSSFDTVYIASPNVFHYAQVMEAIKHNKNVIVEKPAFVTIEQTKRVLTELERHPKVKLFEAARNIHMPAFKAVAKLIKQANDIAGADFTFSQYSSRYDLVLAGQLPNIFNHTFAGGALADLGIYTIYDAVALFGKPIKQQYYPTMISSGVDGKGIAILTYSDFAVTLNFSKMSNSQHVSEIYLGRDLITIDNGGEFTAAQLITPDNESVISKKYVANPMIPELTDFADVLNHPNDQKIQAQYRKWLKLTQQVNETLTNLAKSAGIYYPDKYKE